MGPPLAWINTHPAQNYIGPLPLQAIVERSHQRRADAVAKTPCQRQVQQMIGEVRVLWQQRAMHVRAEDVAVDAAFVLVFAVVAMASQHLSQRTRLRAEIGAAAVVLEADESAAGPGQRHVADAARRGFALVDRPGVEDADSFELRPLGGAVEARKELVAPAHSKHRYVCLHSGP